jgi:hypothetical protein
MAQTQIATDPHSGSLIARIRRSEAIGHLILSIIATT